jgi:hypothetical protein
MVGLLAADTQHISQISDITLQVTSDNFITIVRQLTVSKDQ